VKTWVPPNSSFLSFGVVFHFYDYGKKGNCGIKIPKSTASGVTLQGIVHHYTPAPKPFKAEWKTHKTYP